MSKHSKIFLVILLVLGFATRFVFFGYPNQVVFDETYFGKFASFYMMGNYFFDLHPPLAKMLIAGVGKTLGYDPGFSFATIGKEYPNGSYMDLRISPMTLGALLPALIFLLALELSFSDIVAFFVGLLIVLENSLIVQSRFILTDIFILFFGFLGLLLFFKYRKYQEKRENKNNTGRILRNRYLLLIVSIVFLSAAFSVKWTGISFIGIAGLVFVFDFIRNKFKNTSAFLLGLCAFLIIPFCIYVGSFAIHNYLLFKSGEGDGFMSPAFQKTLIGNTYAEDQNIQPAGFWQKFIETQHVMYSVNYQEALQHHPYASEWYSWPLELRPIYYWTDDTTGAKIYLLGNPVIYWLGSLSILLLGIFIIKNFKKSSSRNLFAGIFIFVGFCANFLPFIFIHRSMFLYHYFPGLIFSILALGYICDRIGNRRYKIGVMSTIIILSIGFFVFFAPFTYGLPLSETAQDIRFWLRSWR